MTGGRALWVSSKNGGVLPNACRLQTTVTLFYQLVAIDDVIVLTLAISINSDFSTISY